MAYCPLPAFALPSQAAGGSAERPATSQATTSRLAGLGSFPAETNTHDKGAAFR